MNSDKKCLEHEITISPGITRNKEFLDDKYGAFEAAASFLLAQKRKYKHYNDGVAV